MAGGNGRSRNNDGQFRQKRSDTKVGTLRETYGDDFAAGYRSDMHLGTLLKRERVPSLTEYLEQNDD